MKTLLVTRPTLASSLMTHGIEPEAVPNPFHPELKAWTVSLTPECCEVIRDYYMKQNLPVPQTVVEVLTNDCN